MASDRHWLVCSATQTALDSLESSLAQGVDANDPAVRVMASYLIAQGGKRIRPALVFLAGSFGPAASDDVLPRAATAAELLHVASLYHDDVLDRADRRRHSASANARWGNMLAALSGTYLFARASILLASFGPWANQITSQALVQLSTGEMLEIEHAYNLDLTELELLGILARKTATLFEFPLRLGAFVAGAPEVHVEILASYGRELGLAFQLADDALDFLGDEAVFGKATGRDLRAGVYTLPVLKACHRSTCGRELRDLLGKLTPTDEDLTGAANLIRQSGAVQETLALARDTAARAAALLSDLPDGAARLSLRNLATYAVERWS